MMNLRELQQADNAQEERENEARLAHESLMDKYNKMIPIVKYLQNVKEIDEFNTSECVVCMETF